MATDDQVTSDSPTTDERDATAHRPIPYVDGERYRLGAAIGVGGMGEVLAARDEQLGREVAIKRLRAREPSERQVTRFLHEARIQGRLDHPAIVPVHELGQDADGLPFFAMKKLAGTTLHDVLRTGAARPRLLRAFADVCLAIEFAHVHGVIHRDIKPENIVLGDFGDVYVLDWGVAKVIGDDRAEDFDDLRGPGTHAGAKIGTPSYMSPEQALDAASVDARTDVFALGKVLAKILASDADAPPELLALVAAATAPDREQRIATARELAVQIQAYLDGDRDLELRRRLAREHLDQARAAFAAAGDEDRGAVIRAASSAMALDPTLAGAAELVGRLMLEPPRELPREVERAIAVEDVSWQYAQGRSATRSLVVAICVAVPLLLVMGSPRGALVYGGFTVLGVVANAIGLRDRATFRPAPSVVLALLNAIGVGILAHLFGPLIVAPAGLATLALTLAANPLLERRTAVVAVAAILSLGALGPLAAEQLGWLATTTDATDAGILVHPPAHTAPWMLLPTATVYIVGMIVVATTTGRSMRAHERALCRRLHMQAWQLRQLVTVTG